jgi:hypothetical protein
MPPFGRHFPGIIQLGLKKKRPSVVFTVNGITFTPGRFIGSLSRPGCMEMGLHLAGASTSLDLFCSALGGFWPVTSLAAMQQFHAAPRLLTPGHVIPRAEAVNQDRKLLSSEIGGHLPSFPACGM